MRRYLDSCEQEMIKNIRERQTTMEMKLGELINKGKIYIQVVLSLSMS
jgi:hypothetical protein